MPACATNAVLDWLQRFLASHGVQGSWEQWKRWEQCEWIYRETLLKAKMRKLKYIALQWKAYFSSCSSAYVGPLDWWVVLLFCCFECGGMLKVCKEITRLWARHCLHLAFNLKPLEPSEKLNLFDLSTIYCAPSSAKLIKLLRFLRFGCAFRMCQVQRLKFSSKNRAHTRAELEEVHPCKFWNELQTYERKTCTQRTCAF